MEKLQSIVRCYPGAPLTAIVDEMKELCDEHESTVTNRFLPEKKKGDAANCWNAYVSCRRSVIRIYANLFQDRTRPRVGVAFLQRQHCSFSLLRAPRREGRDSLCGGLFIRMRVTLSFSNFPRGTRRPRGMQANLETGAGSRTNSPWVKFVATSCDKHFTRSCAMIGDLNKTKNSWEPESDTSPAPLSRY